MFGREALSTLAQPRGDVSPSSGGSASSSALPTAREGSEHRCECPEGVNHFQPKSDTATCQLSADGQAHASSTTTTVSETSAETIRGEGSTPESPVEGVTEDTKSSKTSGRASSKGCGVVDYLLGKPARPSPAAGTSALPPAESLSMDPSSISPRADYLTLAGCVRAAVEKSRRGCKRGLPVAEAQLEPRQFAVPRSDVVIELTDALREVIENVLEKPEIIGPNASTVSLDVILREIQLFKQRGADQPGGRTDLLRVIENCPIVKRKKVMAEVFLDSLTPSEQLRLRSSERKYQRSFSGTSAFETLRYSQDDGGRGLPDSLGIELEHSFAMSTSLLMGLFLSFFAGFNLPRLWGVDNQTAQAVCGLVLCIVCLAVEVGLILVRYAKLSEIKGYRRRKYLQRVEKNREEFGISKRESTSVRVPRGSHS